MRRPGLGIGIGLGLLALAPLTWWISMGFVEVEKVTARDEFGESYYDFLVDPVEALITHRLLVGIVSFVVVVGGLVVLVSSHRRGLLLPGWGGVVVPLAATSVYVGGSYAVVTAPGIGANIGGGLALLFGILFVPAMVGVSWYLYRVMRRNAQIVA